MAANGSIHELAWRDILGKNVDDVLASASLHHVAGQATTKGPFTQNRTRINKDDLWAHGIPPTTEPADAGHETDDDDEGGNGGIPALEGRGR